MNLPQEIVSLEDVPSNPNLLIFSESGAGKTVLGGSDDSVLILNTEPEGEISAKRMGSTASQWKIRSIADMDKVYDWALTLVEKGQEIPFKWFVIDSLTEYQDIDMREILKEGCARKSAKDPYVPEWPDYLKNQKRIIRRVKEFNALPVNILWTCLVTNNTDPEGNDFLYPAIHGRKYEVAQSVCAQMTSYGYLFVKDRFKIVDGKKKKDGLDRYIIWETSGSYRGKDRTFALAPWTKLPERNALKYIREKIEAVGKEKA